MMAEAVIFAGPSLPDRAEAATRLQGRYEGPAAQGDLLRAGLARTSAPLRPVGAAAR